MSVICQEKATVVFANEALKMKACRNTVDRDGVERVAGEEWMVRKIGPYLPGVHELVVEKVKATVLTDNTAVHVVANKSFKDQLGTFSYHCISHGNFLHESAHSTSSVIL